ncbi:MAG: hypothetical protein RJA10_3736 [Pseudomonadota bacterium]|jgi:hypothetical protein
MPQTAIARPAEHRNTVFRWLRRLAVGAVLSGPGCGAWATAFVSYDFSSLGTGPLLTGTLTFSTGMPVIDRCCSWVAYQPSAVVSLTRTIDPVRNLTWSNAAIPNGYCSVRFHVGWTQVSVACQVDDPDLMPGVDLLRIDFYTGHGSSPSWDPDPVGPFTPDNFRQARVSGQLGTIDRSQLEWAVQALSLDAVRITPYLGEPALPALLGAGWAAGWWARRRRPAGRVQQPAWRAPRPGEPVAPRPGCETIAA